MRKKYYYETDVQLKGWGWVLDCSIITWKRRQIKFNKPPIRKLMYALKVCYRRLDGTITCYTHMSMFRLEHKHFNGLYHRVKKRNGVW